MHKLWPLVLFCINSTHISNVIFQILTPHVLCVALFMVHSTQDSLVFSTNGGKEETMQVYLFDHQIIVATPADKEGFFHFKLGIKVHKLFTKANIHTLAIVIVPGSCILKICPPTTHTHNTQTLNGKVSKESTSEFQFGEEGGAGFRFRTDRKEVTELWVADLQSILFSQLQMKRGEELLMAAALMQYV